MTDKTDKTKQGYNLTVTQVTTANRGKNANGKDKITFRAKTMVGKGAKRREIERTVVAQGAAAEMISKIVRKGSTFGIRALFQRAPKNADGSLGGEFLAVVGLPLEKKAA